MFDQITTGGMSGGIRGSFMLVSIAVHGAFVAIVLAFVYYREHGPKLIEPVVVTFRAPPPPPPPLGGHRTRAPRETPKRRVTPKVPPTSIVQPKERVQQKPPDPPPESSDSADGQEIAGVEGGTVDGVVGGVVGGLLGGQGEGPPVLLGAGMTRPVPAADCRPNKPVTPEQARQMGITGLVLVEYTVHGDGHVDGVVLKNPSAPPILFEAVKTWLEQCPFMPSIAGGRPVPVKIVQPFKFTQR